MLIKSKTVLSGIMASTLLLAGMAVRADNAPVQREARTTTVQFGDLNLDRSRDVAALYQRLSLAAERVCGSRAFTGLYYTLPEYRSCVADAVRDAVISAHRARLTAYYLRQKVQQPGLIRVAEK